MVFTITKKTNVLNETNVLNDCSKKLIVQITVYDCSDLQTSEIVDKIFR